MSGVRPRGDRARHAVVGAAMVVLFVVALGIFVLPFAFPTPPPIVTRFQATSLFSPNGDGRRDVARVNVRLSERSEVTLEVQRDGETVRLLADARPAGPGWLRVAWDGRDEAGGRVPDGDHALKLRARAGAKRFNTTRAVAVDTRPPDAPGVSVASATLAGPGRGECRVTVRAREQGSLAIEVRRAGVERPLRRIGPRPVREGGRVRYAWDGIAAGAGRVPPGLYAIAVTQSDAARNRVTVARTCWVGYLSGAPVPPRVAPGEAVGARLVDARGRPLDPATPVILALNRRAAIPGARDGEPIGERVAPAAPGPAGAVRVTVPRGVNPAALWLVARRRDEPGVALIRLGSR